MAVRAAGYLRTRVDAWRTGSVHAQWTLAGVLVALVCLSFVVSLVSRELMPLTAYFLWLLVARVLLSFRPMVVVALVDAVLGSLSLLLAEQMSPIRWVAVVEFLLAVLIVLYVASRSRSNLPGTLSEVLLVDLKERLQAQGRIPVLPTGWEAQSAMLASHGVTYAGDFLVADLHEGHRLEIILVDVCGKGTAAGPAALQFAGALGGLIGSMPPEELMRAANAFLMRQGDEAFATAVHLLVDLDDGSYQITSAGHPPALRWDMPQGEWVIDNARGTALGVLADPELHSSRGRLFGGEALLFYTDGVVEARTSHIDVGIAWLQRTALEAVGVGFGGAAGRIISQVETGDDDRAVLILSRTAVPAKIAEPSV